MFVTIGGNAPTAESGLSVCLGFPSIASERSVSARTGVSAPLTGTFDTGVEKDMLLLPSANGESVGGRCGWVDGSNHKQNTGNETQGATKQFQDREGVIFINVYTTSPTSSFFLLCIFARRLNPKYYCI